jgi:hypothetical protein
MIDNEYLSERFHLTGMFRMIRVIAYYFFPILHISLFSISAVCELPAKIRRLFFIVTLVTTWGFMYFGGIFGLYFNNVILYSIVFTFLNVTGFLIVKRHWQYVFIGVPLLLVSAAYTASLNDHVYLGAMDGFASIVRLQMIYPFVLFYPLLAFFIRNTGVSDRNKGVSLVLTSIVSGIWGISQSYGRDGFLADHPTSVFFVFITIIFLTAGLWLLRNESFAVLIREK